MFEIGNTLREARVRRNLTLQQVEEDTKIRVKYLQAMENEDFDVMPGSTYVKGFLRTYATYLAIDPQVIIDEYRSRGSESVEHEPFGGSSALAPRSHRGRNTLVFVAVICLLVLVVIYILGVKNSNQGRPPTTPGALGIVSTSPSPHRSATPKPGKTAKPAKSPKAAAQGEVRISAADGETWLEVRLGGATGRVLYADALAKGSTKVFKSKTLWIKLGNPKVVRIRVDGRKIPPIEKPGAVAYMVKDGRLVRQ